MQNWDPDKLKLRSESNVAINSRKQDHFHTWTFAFSVPKSETCVSNFCVWTTKQRCVLRSVLHVCCSHEGRRLLPSLGLCLGRRKLTMGHGCNDKSAVGVFTRPCELSSHTLYQTRRNPNGPHLLEYVVLFNRARASRTRTSTTTHWSSTPVTLGCPSRKMKSIVADFVGLPVRNTLVTIYINRLVLS